MAPKKTQKVTPKAADRAPKVDRRYVKKSKEDASAKVACELEDSGVKVGSAQLPMPPSQPTISAWMTPAPSRVAYFSNLQPPFVNPCRSTPRLKSQCPLTSPVQAPLTAANSVAHDAATRTPGKSVIKETIFPSVSQLGDLALACHLRHRPFVAALAELSAPESDALRPWYVGGARPEEPVLNVLFSREMLKGLSKYCSEALQAAEYVSKQNYGDTGTKTVSPYRVLCIGSGCSRLRHYLHFLLSKILPGKDTNDVKVAAVIPRRHMEAETPFHPPETHLALEEALEVYAPRLVICIGMPPGIDWSSAFRRYPSVLEYLLLGPADSERCGHLAETWGGPRGFANRGKEAKLPSYAAAGFADGASQIWALPLRLENGGGEGEIWFALDRRKTGQPWTGDAAAVARSAPPTLWPADEPLTAATNSAVLSVPVAAAPTALPPLAAAVGMLSVPEEPKHEKNAGGILSTSRMLCWLVVLGLLAYYLHVVQPAWFVHFMRKSQTMMAMVHGVHGEREHQFGQFEAAAEMTNPWSWPTTIPSRAPRVPRAASRSTRMYGTLDL
eukprot:s124_g19.t1